MNFSHSRISGKFAQRVGSTMIWNFWIVTCRNNQKIMFSNYVFFILFNDEIILRCDLYFL
jgi:hypothetical protein